MSFFKKFAPPEADPSQNPKIDPLVVWLTRLLDDVLNIPGTKFGVGLDGLIGFIPVIGDAVPLLFAIIMLREAKRLGLPTRDRFKMVVNYAIDFLVGLTPIVGDFLDFAWKANRMNLDILQRFLKEKMTQGGTPQPSGSSDGKVVMEGKYTVKV